MTSTHPLGAGFDLVGQEDLGRPLIDLAPRLIQFQQECSRDGLDIPFLFHAGETLGDGKSDLVSTSSTRSECARYGRQGRRRIKTYTMRYYWEPRESVTGELNTLLDCLSRDGGRWTEQMCA